MTDWGGKDIQKARKTDSFKSFYRAPQKGKIRSKVKSGKTIHYFPTRVFLGEGHVDVTFDIEDGKIKPILSVYIPPIAKSEIEELYKSQTSR